MAFTKKKWVNVPDPSNLPDVPEGQDALARFDAENMNRIEEGVKEAHTSLDTKAPSGHGLGESTFGSSITPYYDFLKKGCGFYQSSYKEGSPRDINEWIGFLQLSRGKTSGGETGAQIAFRDISPNNPQMWLKATYNGTEGDWVEVLHTGNASNLVLNAIDKLPISKGGTGGTKGYEAANNLGVKSIAGGVAVNENDDLNTYTTIGNYMCTLATTASTLSNCPIQSAFVMTVGYAHGGASYIFQEITQFNTGVKYYRVYTVSTKSWTGWQSSYGTANKPTPAEIGAAPAYATAQPTLMQG